MTNLNSLVGFGAGGGGGSAQGEWELKDTLEWQPKDVGPSSGGNNVQAQTSSSYSCLSLRYPGTKGDSGAWTSSPSTDKPYKNNGYLVHYAMEYHGGWTRGAVYCWDLNLSNGTFSALKPDGSGSDVAWSNGSYSGISTTMGHSFPGSGGFWAGGNNAWPGTSSHAFGFWYAECDSTGYKNGGYQNTNYHHQHSGYKMLRPRDHYRYYGSHPSYHSNGYQYHTVISVEAATVSKHDTQTSSYSWGGGNYVYRAIDAPYCESGNIFIGFSGHRNSSYYYYCESIDANNTNTHYHWYASGSPQHNSPYVNLRHSVMGNGDTFVYNDKTGWRYAGKEVDIRYDGPNGNSCPYSGWSDPQTWTNLLNYGMNINPSNTNALYGPISLGDNKYMCQLGNWHSYYWSETNPVVIVEYVEDTVDTTWKTGGFWRIIKSWDAPDPWNGERIAYKNRADSEQHLPIYDSQNTDWPKYMVYLIASGKTYKAYCREVPPYSEWTDRSVDLI
tara:strand:+ start:6125 stop:7621 length:1497 start_codon:yes stop_codon:yes gene_type:complete